MSSHFDQKYMSWCPVYKTDGGLQHGNYSTVDSSSVPPELRDNSIDTKIPPSPPNGGIYGGPQSTKQWANIPVAPTMTNMIHNNLKSANPPPGATVQYIGTDRYGNNYSPMPGVNWYNYDDKTIRGLYRIKGT
jgi:hypothetical protein